MIVVGKIVEERDSLTSFTPLAGGLSTHRGDPFAIHIPMGTVPS